jgi:hypothetical protein
VEAVGDVPRGELDRELQRAVRDLHVVVLLVALAQALEDLERLRRAGRLDHDRLEAAFQRGVLLDVLAVLGERRGADALDLAA